ncbi:MAG TPA: hypothetical protein VFD88_11695, partial [Clostridia bacterium]|nr:hypothetical protein [Clostridia bacterium]
PDSYSRAYSSADVHGDIPYGCKRRRAISPIAGSRSSTIRTEQGQGTHGCVVMVRKGSTVRVR